jgi:hypothetical protein
MQRDELKAKTEFSPAEIEAALNEIRTKPVVDLWPTTAAALDLSRSSVYQAAKKGQIEIVQFGRLKKALSEPLRRKLRLSEAAA